MLNFDHAMNNVVGKPGYPFKHSKSGIYPHLSEQMGGTEADFIK